MDSQSKIANLKSRIDISLRSDSLPSALPQPQPVVVADAQFHENANTLPINREFSNSRTTLEPLVGLRVGLQLSPRWSLGLEGNVSGFSINAERDTTWNFQAGVGYSSSRSVALRIAYVYNGYEFRDGSGLRRSEVDLDQHGLGLRLSIRF